MNPIIVNSIPTCVPIIEFLTLVVSRGFILSSQEVRDPHFNELSFKVKSNIADELGEVTVENITQCSSSMFICECHWSTVEIISQL